MPNISYTNELIKSYSKIEQLEPYVSCNNRQSNKHKKKKVITFSKLFGPLKLTNNIKKYF